MVLIQDLRNTILERLKTEDLVRIPASEEEYFAIAESLPYKVEYHNSEIIAMSLANYWHEVLVVVMGGIFPSIFPDTEFDHIGSNVGVQILKFEGGYYLPDFKLVKGSPKFKPGSKSIITNPYLVVEILSPSTARYDVEVKLLEYKQIDSLQHVLLINQEKPQISHYQRLTEPNTWLNREYFSIEDQLTLEGHVIPLTEIYKKVKFEG
jgi:Uma2 family endonuclease